MKKGRLWEVFEQLDSRDLRELKKCVRSPWFNQREYVAVLYDYFVECREVLDIIPGREEMYRRVFPQTAFEDTRIRNAMSLLMKIIERYLTLKALESDRASAQIALASEYRKMNLPKQYQQTIRTCDQLMQTATDRPADYYRQQYDLEFEKYRSLSAQRRLNAMNLQSISNKLDVAYLAQKLRQTCFAISHSRVYTTDYDMGLLPYLLKVAEAPAYQEVPAIALYYHGYFALTRPDEEAPFRKFKEALFEFGEQFPIQELRDLYLLGTNYCIKRLNAGLPHFAQEALDLYQDGLEKGVLLTEGILSHITFSNVVTVSLVTQNFAFAESFMEAYQRHLDPIRRKSIYSFNLARLQYQKKDFDKALPLLQQEVYKDLLLNLSAKAVSAKIFFELEEYELLLSHLDAMNQFIRRKKVMGYHKDNFQNFIFALRKIVETPDFNKAERQSLKEKIETEKAILERRWLLEQV